MGTSPESGCAWHRLHREDGAERHGEDGAKRGRVDE